MKWIKKKIKIYLLRFLDLDKRSVQAQMKEEASNQINNIISDVLGERYPYRDVNNELVSQFILMVDSRLKEISKKQMKEDVNNIIDGLNINQEIFLDEIVERLKKKQI